MVNEVCTNGLQTLTIFDNIKQNTWKLKIDIAAVTMPDWSFVY